MRRGALGGFFLKAMAQQSEHGPIVPAVSNEENQAGRMIALKRFVTIAMPARLKVMSHISRHGF
jgi:hypothetical protein